MRAATLTDFSVLRYPVYISPKHDGIRCLLNNGVLSKSLKPIPNKFICDYLTKANVNLLDGELMVPGNFQDVTSAVMSEDGKPNFTFHVFDLISDTVPFSERYNTLVGMIRKARDSRICLVPQKLIYNEKELKFYYDRFLSLGYEGIMIRTLDGPYKFGKVTPKEGYLYKLKPVETDEATIVSMVEAYHNNNEAVVNELGLTERSDDKNGLTPKGELGALLCHSSKWGDIKIGSGFNAKQRKDIWENQKEYIGKIAHYSYLPVGNKDRPRHPIFKGFRDERDMVDGVSLAAKSKDESSTRTKRKKVILAPRKYNSFILRGTNVIITAMDQFLQLRTCNWVERKLGVEWDHVQDMLVGDDRASFVHPEIPELTAVVSKNHDRLTFSYGGKTCIAFRDVGYNASLSRKQSGS
jgi:DNA ligase-1